MMQLKDALNAAIYRGIIRFESKTNFVISDITVGRLNTGEAETICTGVSIEVKDRWL